MPIVPLNPRFDNINWVVNAMRKVLGGILGLVAIYFLGLAYAELAHAEEVKPPECSDELAQKIVALYKADKFKVLSLQMELTTLKLAKETVKSKSKTVEKYVLKQEATLHDIEDQKTVKDIKSQLLDLYVKHGKKEDESVILARMQETFDVIPVGNYANKKTRFKNKDLSAYVLAHTLIHKDSPFKTEDAAILWLKSEISEGVEAATRRGSAAANMQETSSNVARLTGYIDPAKGKSEEEIAAKIPEIETAIRDEFTKIATAFASTLSVECAKLASCTDCVGADQVRQVAILKAIDEVGKNLQSDQSLKDKRVAKAIADLSKQGITLDLAQTAEKPAEKEEKKIDPIPQVVQPVVQPAVKDSIRERKVSGDTIPAVVPTIKTSIKPLEISDLSGKPINSQSPMKLSDSQIKSLNGLKEGEGMILGAFNLGACKATVTVEKKGESLLNHVMLVHKASGKSTKVDFESPADPEHQSFSNIAERTISEDDSGKKTIPGICSKK